ncbi:hypothetical protein [Nitrosomonas sp.]|uniref:hypothetical protein n=1 Tax=Nitrosomonas sp. TaxID=42353 RepID=UPI0025E6DAB1|nr:hypothetical protein [Nitrosomonas sp.]MCC6915976.1 hypothetical protein [Nitrosomonas sp.]
MKKFFVFLLLANMFTAFYFYSRSDEGASAQILLIHPEKIKLLPARVACLKWGKLADLVAQYVQTEISKWESGQNRVTEIAGDEISMHWVHIPPLRNAREMTKQIEQLDKLGISYWYVQENVNHPWHNAISLAVLPGGADAAALIEELKNKGLERVTESERIMKQFEFEFEIRDPTDQITEHIRQLANRFPETKLEAAECDRL